MSFWRPRAYCGVILEVLAALWGSLGDLWCPLDLHWVPGGSKVWILGVVLVALGLDFGAEIRLWTMTFPCMLSDWFLEAF